MSLADLLALLVELLEEAIELLGEYEAPSSRSSMAGCLEKPLGTPSCQCAVLLLML